MSTLRNIVNFRLENPAGQLLNYSTTDPWIQIIKNENCFNTEETFPQVKLMSKNLYKYNTSTSQWEHSRMWGLPLFDISGSALRDSTTWSFYGSATVKPNLTRLDLSRNLVVLDFQDLSASSIVPPSAKPSLKYIVVQLHTSEEILLQSGSDYRWYKYVFTGNLINPYDKVDFTPQFAIDLSNSTLADWFNIMGIAGEQASLDEYVDLVANIICKPRDTLGQSAAGEIITNSLCDLSFNSNPNTFGNSYDFNNLLWFSLRSPTFIKSSTQAFDNTKRYIKNFIKANGGGYRREIGTIDLPRKTAKPYGDISAVDISFAPQNGESMLTYSDVTNYVDIEFKPLLRPEGHVGIYYLFGKNISPKTGSSTIYGKSNVTFLRNSTMDGTPHSWPDAGGGSAVITGKTVNDADRNSEMINLSWDTGDFGKKSIRLFDIASGFSKIEATIYTHSASPSRLGDNLFNDIRADPTNYDISSNVFQFRLVNPKNQTNFMVLNQFGNQQTFDLSYVPIGYKPFSFNESFSSGTTVSPLSSAIQSVAINFNKIRKTDSQVSNNIFPTGTINFPSIKPNSYNIDGSSNIIINVNPVSDTTDLERRIVIDSTNRDPSTPPKITFDNVDVNCKTLQLNDSDRGGFFITDYWQYNDFFSDLSDSSLALQSGELNYGDFNVQTKLVGLINLIGVQMDKIKILLNTTGEMFGQDLINSNSVEGDSRILHVISKDGTTITRNFPQFKVLGGDFTTPKITTTPVMITTKPVGLPTPPYINHSTLYPQNFFPNDDISIFQNNTDTKFNIFNAFKNPNNYTVSSASLFFAVAFPPSQDPIIGSPYYNGIYNVNFLTSSSTNSLIHNQNFIDISVNPVSMEINMVELSPGDLNGFQDTFNPRLLLSDGNDQITLTWDGLNYDPATQGNIYWTIDRYNTQNETNKTVTQIVDSRTYGTSTKRFYTYIDRDIRIYDKYIYTITGQFRWYPYGENDTGGPNETARVLTLDVPFGMNGALSHTFDEMIVCKFNRFPYGRFNTTSTNLKLYRPLLLNTGRQKVIVCNVVWF